MPRDGNLGARGPRKRTQMGGQSSRRGRKRRGGVLLRRERPCGYGSGPWSWHRGGCLPLLDRSLFSASLCPLSAATVFAPNEVRMGRLPRLPLTIFQRTGVFGYQSLARDHLAYCDLATDRQQRAYDIVREHEFLAWNVATQPSPT